MSTWVQAASNAEPGTLEVAQPDPQSRTDSSLGDQVNDWLCAWCFNRVACEKDRFPIDGKSEFVFTNPEGILFHILIFLRTTGCREKGEPTLDHTWFPGHAWSYCVCNACGIHLGWHYEGPSEFAGLIRDRIVRALWIRN